MIVEFRNCSLEIRHIGTKEQIAIEIAVDVAKRFCDSITRMAEAIQKAADQFYMAVRKTALSVGRAFQSFLFEPQKPKFYGLHRI